MVLLLTSFVMLSTLTSCGPSIVQGVKIAPTLLQPTPEPQKPKGDYMQDAAAEYVFGLKRSVASCNIDKETIAKITSPTVSASRP